MNDLHQKEILIEIKNQLIKNDFIIGIFIYGSLAKGSINGESTIDLFIIVSENKYIDKINDIISSINSKYSIKPVAWPISDLENSENPLILKVFREGKLIYWNALFDVMASQVFKIRPYTIFTFDLTNLPQIMKVKFNYQLYGKNYDGFLESIGGKRLSKSCFYVSYSNKFKVIRLLNKFEIKFNCLECWF